MLGASEVPFPKACAKHRTIALFLATGEGYDGRADWDGLVADIAVKKRRKRRRRQAVWQVWLRTGIEAAALLVAGLIGVIAALGFAAEHFAGADLWESLLPFAATVLGLVLAAALFLRLWRAWRRWISRYLAWAPAAVAALLMLGAAWCAGQPFFHTEVTRLRTLMGGSAEAERQAIAHQVYAAYRRADHAELQRLLERARVYQATVHEAAAAFGVDAEVLMGVGAAESSFYPRDSADGGRGLFQITAPPAPALNAARRQLQVSTLDPLNQRHNAFVAAATLQRYLEQMNGDLFLGLLAYNIGPRNGGLRSIMEQYGARDFVTIQPYLQHLPRDYPIRVLAAALAYRLWRADGKLPRYEEGTNATHIQRLGIPGFSPQSVPEPDGAGQAQAGRRPPNTASSNALK